MRPIVTDVPWSVCVCVCLLDILMNCAKTIEPIEIPFGVCTRVGPKNLRIRWARNPPPPGKLSEASAILSVVKIL